MFVKSAKLFRKIHHQQQQQQQRYNIIILTFLQVNANYVYYCVKHTYTHTHTHTYKSSKTRSQSELATISSSYRKLLSDFLLPPTNDKSFTEVFEVKRLYYTIYSFIHSSSFFTYKNFD